MIKIDKLFSALVILLPFLYQYASPVPYVSAGEFLLLPLILIYLLIQLIHLDDIIQIDGSMLTFLVVTFVTTCIVSLNSVYFAMYDSITLFLRVIFYACLIFVARSHFKLEYAIKIYSFMTLIFSLYLMLQFAAHMIYGINLPLTLPFEVFKAEQRDYIQKGNLAWYYDNYMFRPSSLFMEPSYFTAYVLGNLCCQLFYTDERHPAITKRNYTIAVIISVALVASASSAGIVALVLVWGYFITTHMVDKKGIFKLKYFLVAIVIVAGLTLLFSSSFASKGVARTLKGASVAARIYRGFYVYGELDLFHQIFGVGLNNLSPYMLYYGLHTPYDEINLNIVASLIGTLICSGWFGFISLCYFLLKLYRRQITLFGKAIVLIIVYFMSFDMIVFSFRWGFYCILAYSTCKLKQKEAESQDKAMSRYNIRSHALDYTVN